MMNATQMSVPDWLEIIRGEFQEIPGLNLTKPQVQRLWGLDPVTSEALLSALLDAGFLRQTATGSYVRADSSLSLNRRSSSL